MRILTWKQLNRDRMYSWTVLAMWMLLSSFFLQQYVMRHQPYLKWCLVVVFTFCHDAWFLKWMPDGWFKRILSILHLFSEEHWDTFWQNIVKFIHLHPTPFYFYPHALLLLSESENDGFQDAGWIFLSLTLLSTALWENSSLLHLYLYVLLDRFTTTSISHLVT